MTWVDSVLKVATPALVVGALIWLGLTVFSALRKRSLNLKSAETVQDADAQPGFLKVDHEKRSTALQGGQAFDAHVEARDASQPDDAPEKARGLAGKCTVLLAVLSLLTGAIGALMRVEA